MRLSWATQLANCSCNQWTEESLHWNSGCIPDLSRTLGQQLQWLTTAGGPANVLRHWCQFKRTRGDEKERSLLGTASWYTIWNQGSWSPGSGVYPTGWWNISSLDLGSFQLWSSFIISLPLPLEKEHMDFVGGAIMQCIEWQRQSTLKNVTWLCRWEWERGGAFVNFLFGCLTLTVTVHLSS